MITINKDNQYLASALHFHYVTLRNVMPVTLHHGYIYIPM